MLYFRTKRMLDLPFHSTLGASEMGAVADGSDSAGGNAVVRTVMSLMGSRTCTVLIALPYKLERIVQTTT